MFEYNNFFISKFFP